MAKNIFSFLLAAAVLTGAAAADADGRRVTRAGYVFGITEETFDQCRHMLRENDRKAFLSMVLQNRCGILKAGVTVYVEDVTWTGKAKIRPQGATATVWTNIEAVRE